MPKKWFDVIFTSIARLMHPVAKKLSHNVVHTKLPKMSSHFQFFDFFSKSLTLTVQHHKANGKNAIKLV